MICVGLVLIPGLSPLSALSYHVADTLTPCALSVDKVGRAMTKLEDIADSATITMHVDPHIPLVSDIQSVVATPCIKAFYFVTDTLTLFALRVDKVGRMMTQLEDIANSATITMHADPRTPRVSDIQSVVALQQRRLSSNTYDRRISSASGMGPTSFPSIHENHLLDGVLKTHASPETPHGLSASQRFHVSSACPPQVARNLCGCSRCLKTRGGFNVHAP
jgi:hypothetical protein